MCEGMDEGTAIVVRDLAIETAGAIELEPGKLFAWLSPKTGHVQVVNLTGDEFLPEPKRKKGKVTVRDVASFALYYGKHHVNEESEIFADADAHTVTAVLNGHSAMTAHWQDHRVVLALRTTPQWDTWTKANQQWMTQRDFAEHLEANIGDIAPGAVSAARLLELAQDFHAKVSVSFSSGSRLRDGTTQIQYVETMESTGGTKGGHVDIPAGFSLGIRPFEDGEPLEVRARLRYRISNRQLALSYHLDDPAGIVRDALLDVVAKVREETAAEVHMGTAP